MSHTRQRVEFYLLPVTGVEVPAELVSVAETDPKALVSPEYAKANVSENAPPLATAAALAGSNHGP
ncbi:MAG TPA: hypothetical protein VKG25_13005, partial [Bryobacteraceae bacterium]|nr:hypothetical protein [Bryobacteraceae bacterium]